MKAKLSLTIVALLLLAAIGCKKNGTGGKAIIKGYVAHHDRKIPNATVYIKYGAKEFPGSDISKYDASVQADVMAYFEIKNLLKGDYYLYGLGFDNVANEDVFGGVPVKLRTKEIIEVNVAVVE
jgi:hypothetical protein